AGLCLRVEDDEMVGICPGIVSGVIDKPPADLAGVLRASMKHDMDATLSTVVTVLRDENVADIAQTQRVGIVGLAVNRLVEALYRHGPFASVGRVQSAINMLQNDSGLIISAPINVRARIFGAAIETMDPRLRQYDQRVPGPDCCLVVQIAAASIA